MARAVEPPTRVAGVVAAVWAPGSQAELRLSHATRTENGTGSSGPMFAAVAPHLSCARLCTVAYDVLGFAVQCLPTADPRHISADPLALAFTCWRSAGEAASRSTRPARRPHSRVHHRRLRRYPISGEAPGRAKLTRRPASGWRVSGVCPVQGRAGAGPRPRAGRARGFRRAVLPRGPRDPLPGVSRSPSP